MIVTRGLGRGGRGQLVAHGLGLRIIDLTTGSWFHDGTAYRRVKQTYVKRDGQWVQPREVWKKTSLGWQRVV